MPNRIIPGQKFYTGGTGIEIDNDKVISLKLRDENNLIFVNENNEIYVDLQLPDGIEPTDAFPVGVTTGRVLVADGRDKTGTIICAKTTSGDEIEVLYADDGTLWMDNGTGTFKQIYFKADVDAIVQAIWDYIHANCNTKSFGYTTSGQAIYDRISNGNNYALVSHPHNGSGTDGIFMFGPTTTTTGDILSLPSHFVQQGPGGIFYEETVRLKFSVTDGVASVISIIGSVIDGTGRIIISNSVAPSNAIEGTTWYDTINDELKVYDGSNWNKVGGSDIEYVTQAEYDALPSSKLTDNKHYFIYSESGPTPPIPGRPTITGFNYVDTLSSYTGGDVNGMTWKPDGTKFYITGEQNNTVYQYSVSTPRDVTTATYDNKSVATTLNVSNSIIFSDDGLTMWIGGGWGTGYVYKWTLSTAWDVSTATYVGDATGKSNISFSECTGYWMANDGQYLFVISRGSKWIRRYTMLTPYDITTLDATYQEYSNIPDNCHKVLLNPLGTQLFYFGRDVRKIHICALSTAFDLTTISETSQYTVPTPNTIDITSVVIDNSGNSMWIGGYNIGGIYQYSTTTA